jgi:simple sugar transport system ATP-binding protein
MQDTFLDVRHISKRFGGVQALRDVSLTLGRGEIHCLAGENGSGKSTLIKIIAGVCRPDEGEIIVNGHSARHLRPIDAVREGIQVIYQDLSLFPNLTVAENLAINTLVEQGCRWARPGHIRRVASEALVRLGFEIDLRKEVAGISAAERQLVAIARALLQDARLIIMDEPTTALTHREIDSLFRIIRNLQARGISTLFVSHKLTEVLDISDKITVLRNGGKVAEGDTSGFDYGALVRHMTGREIRRSECASPWEDKRESPLLRVQGLCRRDAFSDIGFDLGRGEILGIAGLLGSGRTELATSLFGLTAADRGTIEIDDRTLRPGNVQDAMTRGIAYIPDDRLTEGLFLEQSIERNISAADVSSFAGRGGWLDLSRMREAVRQWMTALSIAVPSPAVPVQSLSGGNQQKVVLAKWLAGKAGILILNGPTVGVDVGAKAEIHGKLMELAHKGMGIIVISDDLPELASLCRRVLVMHRGRIVDELAMTEADESALASRLSALE